MQLRLKGKTFVLTGVFPELATSTTTDHPINLGKSEVKRFIERHGGRVTGAVSGKTSYVVCGKAPGATKVMAANSHNLPVISFDYLVNLTEETVKETIQVPIVTFSKGINNNGRAYEGAFLDIK